MPTSSARPDLLRHAAHALEDDVRRLDRLVAEATEALHRYQAASPDAPPPGRPDLAASALLGRARSLAGAVAQLADAFAAADRGDPSVATAPDLILSRRLERHHPGIAVGALLAPVRHAEGRAAGRRLAEAGPEEAARLLSSGAPATHDPAYAAGLVAGLGTAGLVGLGDGLAAALADHRLTYHEADAAYVALGELLDRAASELPALPHVPLPQDAAAPDLTAPGALDLSIVAGLGRTDGGRHLARHLALDRTAAHPALVATLAGAVLDPFRPGPQDLAPPQALLTRLRHRGLPEKLDLPVLRLLAADPAAAGLWELGSPPGASRLGVNLSRRTSIEAVEVAAIAHALYVAPVADGRGRAWEPPVAGVAPTAGQQRTDRALAAIVAAAPGAAPHPATSGLLADLVATHPAFFVDQLADQRWETLRPHEPLIGYFQVVAGRPEALQRATDAIVAHGADVSADCLAAPAVGGPPATTPPSDHLRTCLQPVRDLGLTLERGAHRAGRHVDLVNALGVAAATRVAQMGVGAVAKVAGPAGPLVGYLGDGLVTEGKARATDRWVDTNGRLDRAPAQAIDRSLPFLAALAMADDGRLGATLVDVDDLRRLDVVRSPADWATFLTWIDRQPPAVHDALTALLAGDP